MAKIRLADYKIQDFIIFRVFLANYLLPLCGMPENKIRSLSFTYSKLSSFDEENLIRVEHNKNSVLIFIRDWEFELDFSFNAHNDDIKNLFKNAVMFYAYYMEPYKKYIPCKYWINHGKEKYKSNKMINFKSYKDKIYNDICERSIKKAIILFINKDNLDSDKIEDLLIILDNWSKKTYEGHNVCFGIVIDFGSTADYNSSNYHNDFLSFLKNEFSAVLSDGITSLFFVDKKCDFIKYVSSTKLFSTGGSKLMDNISDSFLPYRFFETLSSYVDGDKVGLCLLNNGDLLVAKNKEIRFIHRSGKWMNFSQFEFIKTLNENSDYRLKSDLLKNIYTSVLDVSLAHTGGIIAVVDYNLRNISDLQEIINDIDSYYNINDTEESLEKLYKKELIKNIKKLNDKCPLELKEIIEKDEFLDDKNNFDKFDAIVQNNSICFLIKEDVLKRMTKRFFVSKLISKNKFFELDRKLRAELLGMDGAFIIDKSGDIVAIGAIIKNDSGSSGGARGSAARKLSTYGGFSIKVSTDGYIEVYSSGNVIYSIK